MADTQTTNLNLTKPEPGAAEDTWGISLNADLDTLDAIFSSSGTQVNLNPNQINFANNKKAIFGANSNLSIYYDGNHSYIEDSGSGNLRILVGDLQIRNHGTNENVITSTANAEVTLYHNASPKLATTSTGIDVTGTVNTDSLTVTGDIEQTTGDLKYTGNINWDIAHHGASQNMIFRTTPSGGSATQRIRVSHNGDISFYDDTGSSAAFFWDASAEKLGIGNTNPAGSVHIKHSTGTSLVLDATITGSSLTSLAFQRSSTNKWRILQYADDRHLLFYNDINNINQLCLKADGKIGIGTDLPSHKLTVEGTTSSTTARVKTTTGNANLRLSTNNSDFAIIGQGGSNKLTVYDNNASTTRLALDSSGNVLVGKTSADFSVYGLELVQTGAVKSTVGNSYCLLLNRKDSDGDIINFRKDSSTVGSISVTSSATTYNTSSDARLKDVTGEARGLEVINELNPVAYNWKADGKADEGLIAQEVQEIVPNAVSGSEEEHYQMDYSKLVVHLVKAVQELEQQATELKKEIANLKGE